MENWARITYSEMTNFDDDIYNDNEYQLEMGDVSNDISRELIILFKLCIIKIIRLAVKVDLRLF